MGVDFEMIEGEGRTKTRLRQGKIKIWDEKKVKKEKRRIKKSKRAGWKRKRRRKEKQAKTGKINNLRQKKSKRAGW